MKILVSDDVSEKGVELLRQKACFRLGQFARIFHPDFFHRPFGQIDADNAHAFHKVEIRLDGEIYIFRQWRHWP